MRSVLRGAIVIGLSLAVEAAGITTPFLHAHLDDHATEHHGSARAIHSHLSPHSHPHPHSHASQVPFTGTVIDDDDHEAPVFFPLFVAVGSQTVDVAPAAITVIDLPAPAEAPAHRSVLVVHGHDPPFHRLLPSRAPPAFLS